MSKTFQKPSEFSDEDKWFKFFKKKSLFVLISSLIIGYFLIQVSLIFGTILPGIILAIIEIIAFVGSTMFIIPDTEYLRGAGQSFDVLIARRIIRRRKRIIYIKGFSNKVD